MRRSTLARRVTMLVALGWLCVLVALVLLIVVTARNETAVDRLVNQVAPTRRVAAELFTTVVEEQNAVRGYALTADPARRAAYQAEVDHQEEQVVELSDLLARDDPRAVELLRQVLDAAGKWRTSGAEPLLAVVQRLGPRPPADAMYQAEERLFAPVLASSDELVHELQARQVAAVRGLAVYRRTELAALLAGGMLAALAGAATLLLVRRWVIRPIERVADDARRVADGEHEHRVAVPPGPPELTQVASDVERMRHRIVSELETVAASQAELRAAQEELREQAVDLMRSNRDLEQFAYVASHDLQEPLRKVAGFCQLLQRRYAGQLDERAETYIEFAVDGARRMQRLINELLAFSRVGRGETRLAEVSLADVVAESLAELESASQHAGAVIEVGELPRVRGDPALLRQLLTNLVGNALKFSRPEVAPKVRIDAEPDPMGWRISVADNGIGIEPEYADKIFVLFQRLHSRDAHPGTGIGLALAKRIVEYHGGRIWLDTERRDGATIRFTLPEKTKSEEAT